MQFPVLSLKIAYWKYRQKYANCIIALQNPRKLFKLFKLKDRESLRDGSQLEVQVVTGVTVTVTVTVTSTVIGPGLPSCQW
jgi:hypothetical protein